MSESFYVEMFTFISISAYKCTKSHVIDEDCHYAIYFI